MRPFCTLLLYFLFLSVGGSSLGENQKDAGQNGVIYAVKFELSEPLPVGHEDKLKSDASEKDLCKENEKEPLEDSPFPVDAVASSLLAYDHIMRLENGSEYRCTIPPKPTPQSDIDGLSSQPFEEALSAEETAQFHKALDGICIQQLRDWWTYKLCWNGELLQFHLELGRHQINSLGKMDGRGEGGIELRYGRNSHGMYISTELTGGTVCAITGMPRRSTVQLRCLEDPAQGTTIEVTEQNTCQYLVLVKTPRVCVGKLAAQKEPVVDIVCRPVVRK